MTKGARRHPLPVPYVGVATMPKQRETHYDAVVIGAGQAGGPLATAFANACRKTAIVERADFGGTCINVGCTPTKTIVASARVAYLARRGSDYGVETGEIAIDLPRVRQRKRDIVESFRSGGEKRLYATRGLDVMRAQATFTGPKSLSITDHDGNEQSITADLIVINTGARPAIPSIAGIENVPYLTSTTIMECSDVPNHLIVLGGGVVGLEFGQMFRRFGSRVTIVQRGDRLLGREDKDVADAVADVLREDEIEIVLNATAKRVRLDGDRIALTVETNGREQSVTGSHLLAAAGRTPNTDDLGLDAAGIERDKRGAIPVDERLQTNVPGIYAVGDVNGGPAFTHISYDDYRILKTNLINGGDARTTGRLVPYTVFIDPQLGRVGMTEAEAKREGREIRVATIPMNSVARALEVDESRGLMKAIVDANTDQILGCAILGIEGGELMSMLEIAMMGKLPYAALRDGIFAHPTLAESLNNLFNSFREP
jgi:pyruvate/2-oxoglutarate dehydrogenase complex dihydrolipoamide dehydrogenase (E3) component